MIKIIKDLFRPVLSDHTILKYNKKNLLIEGEINKDQLQPNSVDLTLANSYKVLVPNSGNNIDPIKTICYTSGNFPYKNKSIDRKYYVLEPHQFALMASRERLNIPNGIISFVQGRSSIARIAIQTEQAGLIDSGFKGTITFEVFNQSEYPIILYEGMRIAQVYFFKAQYADRIYGAIDRNSKYNGQRAATGSMINQDF